MELVDALTGALIEDPVRAADGHVYDRRALTSFFEQRRAAEQPIVSPQDLEKPMGEELSEAPEVKAKLDELRADVRHGAKHVREPPQSYKSLSALRSVFDVLDPLSELLAETLKGWQTPVVVVFGNENTGKSSLLERLAMMPLLPRGNDEGTCTRLPIVLKLRHTKEASPPVLVVRDSTTGKEEVRRVVSVAGGEVDVRREMERVIAAEHEGLSSVSTTRTIEVHVHSPAVPSIDLVDLPGLKAVGGERDAADMPDTVRRLVLAQIERYREMAVFLVTCTASMAPEQSQAMQLVHELGLQDRTIGVLTMCDDVGTRAMKPLPGRLQQTAGGMPLQPHRSAAPSPPWCSPRPPTHPAVVVS